MLNEKIEGLRRNLSKKITQEIEVLEFVGNIMGVIKLLQEEVESENLSWEHWCAVEEQGITLKWDNQLKSLEIKSYPNCFFPILLGEEKEKLAEKLNKNKICTFDSVLQVEDFLRRIPGIKIKTIEIPGPDDYIILILF